MVSYMSVLLTFLMIQVFFLRTETSKFVIFYNTTVLQKNWRKTCWAKFTRKLGSPIFRIVILDIKRTILGQKKFGALERKSSVCTISWVTLNNIYKHYLVPS